MSIRFHFLNFVSNRLIVVAVIHSRKMKSLLLAASILLPLARLFGQVEVELFFMNSCDHSVTVLNYELTALNDTKGHPSADVQSVNGKATVPEKGTYQLSSSLSWGNLIGMFDQIIEITDSPKQVDTIYIPRIKFTGDGVLHSKYWNYFNCQKLCDGHETDYYPNGQKRLEGEFVKGKPNRITEYETDGTKKVEYWYVPGTLTYSRVNWFDKAGKLDEYDVYKTKKRKTVKTTYTSYGKQIAKEIIRHEIEK